MTQMGTCRGGVLLDNLGIANEVAIKMETYCHVLRGDGVRVPKAPDQGWVEVDHRQGGANKLEFHSVSITIALFVIVSVLSTYP